MEGLVGKLYNRPVDPPVGHCAGARCRAHLALRKFRSPATSMTESLFKNRDRVRVDGSNVVHLRTGRRVPLVRGGPVASIVRTVLSSLQEKPGEEIDLAPPVGPFF